MRNPATRIQRRQTKQADRAGQAFGIGPAIGRVMADLPTGRPPGHDLTRFRPQRFADGSEIVPRPY